MNLENLESKEPLIKEFFIWLFDDENIILTSEIDLTLVQTHMDANIYYPKQIADFFNTKAMQRLGRVSQLDLAIDEFPNLYHNRLDHCKGVYYRKLEEMLYNFQNSEWKQEIENNNMKLYLLAELIKMAGHDIGHLPLSHALEVVILSQRGAHEIIGQRIMSENDEIQTVLQSISPDLPNILRELYEKPILNFREHDESNYDVDRFDYILRDNLYAGNHISIPYAHYETISTSENTTIDVYDYDCLDAIEQFLEIRESGYKNMYFLPKTHVREHSIDALFETFLLTDSQSGKGLRNFVNILRTCDINEIDLSIFLDWDEIKFYSEILDIAQNHEDANVRDLATMTVPNMNAFLTLLYSHLNIHKKGQNYSAEDKQFLQKIKSFIIDNDSLSQNLKSPNFAMDNTLLFPEDEAFPYDEFIKNGLIHSSKLKIKAYNPKEPIYIRGKDNEIYELSNHPDRKCDWDTSISEVKTTYAYIPFLRFHGISEDKIEELRRFCNTRAQQNVVKETCKINMQPLQVGHNIEDYFLEL